MILEKPKMQQAINRDKLHRLELMEPLWKGKTVLAEWKKQTGVTNVT